MLKWIYDCVHFDENKLELRVFWLEIYQSDWSYLSPVNPKIDLINVMTITTELTICFFGETIKLEFSRF